MVLQHYGRMNGRCMEAMAIATNIRLPEDLLKALKYKAIEENKSMNRLICEAIERSLADLPSPEGKERDPFENVIGVARSGIRDASSKHDRYLYGGKK
jgi:hypothetical protein